jgi:hypothetical protein
MPVNKLQVVNLVYSKIKNTFSRPQHTTEPEDKKALVANLFDSMTS